MLTADIPSLTLRALPPLEAYDFEYYKARLTDPALLAGAVAICIFRAPLLAIPVGGAAVAETPFSAAASTPNRRVLCSTADPGSPTSASAHAGGRVT